MTIPPYGWHYSMPEQPPHRLGMYSESFPGASVLPVARVSPFLRVVARGIDWALILLVSSPLWIGTWIHLKHEAVLRAAEFTGSGFLELFFGRWGAIDEEAMSQLSDFWGTVVLWLVGTFVLQVLLMAVYDLVLHRRWGRSLGKALLSLNVVQIPHVPAGGAAVLPSRLPAGKAVRRTVLTVVLPGAAWAVLLAAVLQLSVLLFLASALLFLLSVVECAAFRSSPLGRTCWHDRRSSTVVVPRKWLNSHRYLMGMNHQTHSHNQTFSPPFPPLPPGFGSR